MPTAKTPTAIESTTRMVRVLLLDRSRSTLRQRGLSMRHHLLLILARRSILCNALVRHAIDLRLGGWRLGHQMAELIGVERNHLDTGVGPGADSRDVRAAVQQLDLAEVLAKPHGCHHDLGSARLPQHDLNLPSGDDIEVIGRLALAEDG